MQAFSDRGGVVPCTDLTYWEVCCPESTCGQLETYLNITKLLTKQQHALGESCTPEQLSSAMYCSPILCGQKFRKSDLNKACLTINLADSGSL